MNDETLREAKEWKKIAELAINKLFELKDSMKQIAKELDIETESLRIYKGLIDKESKTSK